MQITHRCECGRENHIDIDSNLIKQSIIEEAEKKAYLKGQKYIEEKLQRSESQKDIQIKDQNEELANQSKEIGNLKAATSDLKRKNQDLKNNLNQQVTKAVNDALIKQSKSKDSELREYIDELKKTHANELALIKKDYEVKFTQLSKSSQVTQRQAEQGSMQLQGESQELVIEDRLRANFPNDEVKEIKKGAYGADCVLTVKHNEKRVGKILIESKRTEAWAETWVDKLKSDQADESANIAIIVSKTLPSSMKQSGLYKGIYVTNLKDFNVIIEFFTMHFKSIQKHKTIGENQHTKQGSAYSYITSPEFGLHFNKVVDTANAAIDRNLKQLNSNKQHAKAMHQHIMEIVGSMADIHGSLEVITGGSVPAISGFEQKMLEVI